jgi:hypothetical protein
MQWSALAPSVIPSLVPSAPQDYRFFARLRVPIDDRQQTARLENVAHGTCKPRSVGNPVEDVREKYVIRGLAQNATDLEGIRLHERTVRIPISVSRVRAVRSNAASISMPITSQAILAIDSVNQPSPQHRSTALIPVRDLHPRALWRGSAKAPPTIPRPAFPRLERNRATSFCSDPRLLEADHVVIATGSRARPLKLSGAELLKTSDDLLNESELLDSIVFIGGGSSPWNSVTSMRARG